MSKPAPMRVLVEARLDRGSSGGVETVLQGIAEGLGQLDGDDSFTFLVNPDGANWITERLGNNCPQLSPGRANLDGDRIRWQRRLRMALPVEAKVAAWWLRGKAGRRFPNVVVPPAPVDTSGFDVVHFPFQSGFRTSQPFVFQPHDLQHLHLPHFFTAYERRRRAAVYRTLCDRAAAIVVGSKWVARDLAESMQIDPEKIKVINLAPLSRPAPSLDELGDMGLPDAFAYYPAATWQHKNHQGLLHAAAALRDAGIVVPFVFTGHLTKHFAPLQQLVVRLGLDDQVRFLGFVSDGAVAALFAKARLVVVPTLFEAGSFPIWEAFAASTPVACSSVTSLPEQAGDAALLFDPQDQAAMASAIATAWTDEAVRTRLVDAGRRRLAGLTWRNTAERLLSVYRLAAGRATDEDTRLLASDTTI